jgi:hypothetical protein
MPLAGVKGACLLLRSELVANACNCSKMNLPEPWRCPWHVENRVTSMNPQHTSTACWTVVTEAVCVLLSTQPTLPHLTSSSAKKGPGPVFCVHGFSTSSARGAELFLSTTTTTCTHRRRRKQPQDNANNRPEAASEAHGAEVIAFPICYIALASKSGASSAGNLEQLSNSRLHPSLHHPSIPSAQPSCLAVPLSAQFGPSPKYKPTSQPQLAAQGQAEKNTARTAQHLTTPTHPRLYCALSALLTGWATTSSKKKPRVLPTYIHTYIRTYLTLVL